MPPFEARPYTRSTPSNLLKTQLRLATTPEEWDIIAEEAEKRGLSKSQFLRNAIAAYIKE